MIETHISLELNVIKSVYNYHNSYVKMSQLYILEKIMKYGVFEIQYAYY